MTIDNGLFRPTELARMEVRWMHSPQTMTADEAAAASVRLLIEQGYLTPTPVHYGVAPVKSRPSKRTLTMSDALIEAMKP